MAIIEIEHIEKQLYQIAAQLHDQGNAPAGQLVELAARHLRSPEEVLNRVAPVPSLKRISHTERYKDYIRQLGPGVAGRLDLEPRDVVDTERSRLLMAARAEGVRLKIKAKRGVIVFWPEPNA
jgi:hypothetical protein